MVILLPATFTTTLLTPSLPNPLVSGPLLWGICPGLHSSLRQPGRLAQQSIRLGVSAHNQTPSSTPILPNFTVGTRAQRGRSSLPETQQIGFPDSYGTEVSHCLFWESPDVNPTVQLGQGQASTTDSKYQEYHVACPPLITHAPPFHWIPSPMGVLRVLGSESPQ